MRSWLALGACTTLALGACRSGERVEPAPIPENPSPEASQALDDSISVLVDAYKAGRLSRNVAAEHLAGLIEPLPGFAIQTTDSMTLDLFNATQAVLRERVAARYNLPDSLR